MIIYQEYPQNYKSGSTSNHKRSCNRRLKVLTSNCVLKRKNIEFLKSLGLKVKNKRAQKNKAEIF